MQSGNRDVFFSSWKITSNEKYVNSILIRLLLDCDG
jgi:hypothetical protein